MTNLENIFISFYISMKERKRNLENVEVFNIGFVHDESFYHLVYIY